MLIEFYVLYKDNTWDLQIIELDGLDESYYEEDYENMGFPLISKKCLNVEKVKFSQFIKS